MSEIVKFSLVYDVAEDRIAWDLEDEEGGGTRLWLTQRLVRGLVAAVIPLVSGAPQAAADEQGAEPPPAPDASLQAWEQAAAMSGFGKTKGVRVTPESTAGLVSTVHINTTTDGLSFTFEFGNEQRTVGASGPAVRQTLSVLHSLHVQAGWPLDLWPAWIADPAGTAAVADTGRLN